MAKANYHIRRKCPICGTIFEIRTIDAVYCSHNCSAVASKRKKTQEEKEKERIDKINQADAMIFQTEKSLKELGDKLPADKKAQIEAALNELKDAHKKQDIAAIDAATAKLNEVFHAASQDMYNNAGAGQQQSAQQGGYQNPGANGNANNNNNGGTNNAEDVDYEEVK